MPYHDSQDWVPPTVFTMNLELAAIMMLDFYFSFKGIFTWVKNHEMQQMQLQQQKFGQGSRSAVPASANVPWSRDQEQDTDLVMSTSTPTKSTRKVTVSHVVMHYKGTNPCVHSNGINTTESESLSKKSRYVTNKSLLECSSTSLLRLLFSQIYQWDQSPRGL